jgi:hypothetical protein
MASSGQWSSHWPQPASRGRSDICHSQLRWPVPDRSPGGASTSQQIRELRFKIDWKLSGIIPGCGTENPQQSQQQLQIASSGLLTSHLYGKPGTAPLASSRTSEIALRFEIQRAFPCLIGAAEAPNRNAGLPRSQSGMAVQSSCIAQKQCTTAMLSPSSLFR